jgi:hypothetical protein
LLGGVLQCDKTTCFCHIAALAVQFLVQALIVQGEDGLSCGKPDEQKFSWLQDQ